MEPTRLFCPWDLPGKSTGVCCHCLLPKVSSPYQCVVRFVAICSFFLCCCCSVTQSCLTLCDPMDWSTPGFPVLHHLLELAQTHVHWVSDAIQPSHPLLSLLLPPSIFPSIRVFSSKSVLHIRWSKYWSFSFSISPSNEYLVPVPISPST